MTLPQIPSFLTIVKHTVLRVLFLALLIIYPPLSPAHAFPAQVVLNDMSEEQRYAYMAGFVVFRRRLH